MESLQSEKTNTFFSYVKGKKLYVFIAFFTIFAATLVMSKVHPKKMSYAKEYSHMYRVLFSMQNGSEFNLDRLENKLAQFPALSPVFDPILCDQYLKGKDIEQFNRVYAKIEDRLFYKNALVSNFSKGSAFLDVDRTANAMMHLTYYEKNNTQKKSLFSLYSMYRMSELYKEQGNRDKYVRVLAGLKKDLRSHKDGPFASSYLYKKMAGKLIPSEKK